MTIIYINLILIEDQIIKDKIIKIKNKITNYSNIILNLK